MDEKKLLEIKQRSASLMRQAVLIWQTSNHAEDLEGLDSDPAFQLLMTALAYQFNEIDDDIEVARQQVINEFADVLLPYSVDRVMPTSVVVESAPSDGVAEMQIDHTSIFSERSNGLPFIPILRTRVLNASVGRVVRLDGRRWRVTMEFPEGLTTLDGLTFAIKDLMFRDLTVSVSNRTLSLIKPWNAQELPFTEPFDFTAKLYNEAPVFNAATMSMEILARQDVCLFYIDDSARFPEETSKVDFVFEFTGIGDDFVLDKTKIHLNVNVLVNARINTVTLTEKSPIARIPSDEKQHFMQLLPPLKDQIFSHYTVGLRRVMSDRFNLSGLVRLTDCLLTKYKSDFYAFQLMSWQDGDNLLQSLSALLQKLRQMAASKTSSVVGGIYVFLKDEDEKSLKVTNSYDVRYLTTDGQLSENAITRDSLFSAPAGIDISKVRQISEPLEGKDTGFDRAQMASYFIATSDRVITPADIRMFCVSHLCELLRVGRDMIKSVSVSQNHSASSPTGFEIGVDIHLVSSAAMRKAAEDRIPRLECLLESILAARSVNIYPIKVTIQIG